MRPRFELSTWERRLGVSKRIYGLRGKRFGDNRDEALLKDHTLGAGVAAADVEHADAVLTSHLLGVDAEA